MVEYANQPILTINTGSSSLKFTLFDSNQVTRRVVSGQAERIGNAAARLLISDGDGAKLLDQHCEISDHGEALHSILTWLRTNRPGQNPIAVGHRVVHGGSRYREPERITSQVIAALQELVPIDPDHMPQAIQTIQASVAAFPDLPQIACF